MDQHRIKACFFDIDGTLTGLTTHQINPVDLQSLRTINENGCLLFLATGRDSFVPEEFAPVMPLMPFLSGIIDINGQHCALQDGTVVSCHPIANEDLIPVRESCAKHHLSIYYSYDHRNYLTEMTDHVERYWKWFGIPIPEIRPLEPDMRDMLKVCIHCSPEEEAAYLTPLLKHTWTARITEDLCDLIPNGIGKDSGIREMCAHFGFSLEETMGFGDGQNDICMLNTVGIAVAMQNGTNDVKAAADFVTKTTEEGGITHALKHFGLLPA